MSIIYALYLALFLIACGLIGAFVGSIFDYISDTKWANPKYNNKIKWRCLIVSIIMFACLFMGFGFGMQTTIEDLTLDSVTDDGYTIIVRGEVHEYSFK